MNMATARRNGNGGKGGAARPWVRGMVAVVSAALVGVPLPVLSQVDGLDDLIYQNSDYASRSMPQRGYVLTGSAAAKGNSFWQYWWSDSRGQCVRLAVNDYRVTQLIGTGARDCHRGSNAPVAPQARSDNSDLVNQSEDYVARQLPWRGYVLSHSASAKGGSYWQYWWSSQRDQCVRVAVNGGRVSQLITTDEHDCNQTASGSSGPSKGAQVAIAAAALAGVAVLAHKSHENDKDRAAQSPQDVAEFERGYRDALYNQGYHNYNNRPDYSNGYNKGSEKRSTETSYRSNQGHHSGYSSYVNVNDLVGARAAGAEGDLQARGFRNTSSYKANDRAHTYWWNSSTRQCLNAAVYEGRVESLQSTGESYCQR